MTMLDPAIQQRRCRRNRDFHALYARHHGWLRAWIGHRLHGAHAADDLAQDTFLRVLASSEPLSSLREPRAYLAVTARRLLIDRSRREAIERAWLDAVAATAGEAREASCEEVAEALQLLVRLAGALDALPARHREAFLLHYLEGMPQAEVAARLGVSARMVRKYLAQALAACAVPD